MPERPSARIGWARPSQPLKSPTTLTARARRRPDGERRARRAVERARMRAERVPQPLVAALADEVQVELAERRRERVRIAQHERRRVRVADLQAVPRQRAAPRQQALIEPCGMAHLELDGLAPLRQHAHRLRCRAECAHHDAAIDLMRPEHRVRVRVLAGDDALELVGERHAAHARRAAPGG